MLCASGTVVVHVRNGRVKSVDGKESIRAPNASDEEGRITVEALFDRIDRIYARRAEYLNVRYDLTFGYPRFIAVDFRRAAADDELIQNISLKVVDATDSPSLERP
jgi:hypothetical protein